MSKNQARKYIKSKYKYKNTFKYKAKSLLNLRNLFILIYVLFFGLFACYHLYFADRVVYKVSVEGINVSNKSVDEVIELIKTTFKPAEYVEVKIDDKNKYKIYSSDINFKYSDIQTAQKAYEVGRENVYLLGIPSKIKALKDGVKIKLVYSYDDEKLYESLKPLITDNTISLKEPTYGIVNNVLTVNKGSNGKEINIEKLKGNIIEELERVSLQNSKSNSKDNGYISFNTDTKDTVLNEEDLNKFLPKVREITSKNYHYNFEDRKFEIKKGDILSAIKISKEDNILNFDISEKNLTKIIEDIKAEVDRNPKALSLSIENGKAVKFTGSVDGIRVNILSTLKNTKDDILNLNENLSLKVDVAKAPEVKNEYGIEELVGTGRSKFKGSIVNRVYNVGLASSKIDGVIIAPNEEFSFLKTVGQINRDEGYKSAYVISKGRTILGDGGGVCQVSTTLFRAVLDAGLPIITRTAHAYRVGYYEQDSGPGLDATVFYPTVDFKFRNNYGTHLLITREFDAKNMTLVFKIYSKKDGRIVEVTKPTLSNQTAPPPTIYEENPDLPKGTKIQTEHSVWGATTVFNRTVTINGNTTKDTYKSNYRAWPAVYTIGTKE